MGSKSMHTLHVQLPEGITASIEVPSELDQLLVGLALRLFAGSFAAIMKSNDLKDRREFLIRFVAATGEIADTAIRSTQMANKLHSSDKKTIVEDLLKSLHD